VQSIEKVTLQIMGQFGRLADPGYEAHILGITAKVRQGLF
jgi:cell division protein ZapA (FtsZ GTPase activity inhibitor)